MTSTTMRLVMCDVEVEYVVCLFLVVGERMNE